MKYGPVDAGHTSKRSPMTTCAGITFCYMTQYICVQFCFLIECTLGSMARWQVQRLVYIIKDHSFNDQRRRVQRIKKKKTGTSSLQLLSNVNYSAVGLTLKLPGLSRVNVKASFLQYVFFFNTSLGKNALTQAHKQINSIDMDPDPLPGGFGGSGGGSCSRRKRAD